MVFGDIGYLDKITIIKITDNGIWAQFEQPIGYTHSSQFGGRRRVTGQFNPHNFKPGANLAAGTLIATEFQTVQVFIRGIRTIDYADGLTVELNKTFIIVKTMDVGGNVVFVLELYNDN